MCLVQPLQSKLPKDCTAVPYLDAWAVAVAASSRMVSPLALRASMSGGLSTCSATTKLTCMQSLFHPTANCSLTP